MNESKVIVPLDIPLEERKRFMDNYLAVTKGSGRLMLFAGDQKVEHLNDDFYGNGISKDDADPEHLLRIASKAHIGAFATQFGLIARYAMDYPKIPYVVKLNSKTQLIGTSQAEPLSQQWITVDQVVELRDENELNITGVGYTVYLGSEYEAIMLKEAAQIVHLAHRHGLLTILWMYPRGKAVQNERNAHLVAGAAGAAACLGSDFAKVNYPDGPEAKEMLQEAVFAAGRTKVVCSGGSRMEVEPFLRRLHNQIHVSRTSGNATGRNIHQKPLDEAIRFCNSIYAITIDNASVEEAMQIYWGNPST